MTHETRDFEHALDLANVVGVEYDDRNGVVQVFVAEKKPEAALAEGDIVSNAIEGFETDVVEIGELRAESREVGLRSHERARPVQGGASEGPASRNSAGTGGMLARVEEPSEHFAESVDRDDLVRLSNNHVYAGSKTTPGAYDETLRQPARLDGGTEADTVGELVGYVPLTDGARVDIAARRANPEVDALGVTDLDGYVDPSSNPEVIRGDYSGLHDASVIKRGRTTGVTRGVVVATDATVNVQFSVGTVTFRNQIITTDMSRAGDSGSHVFTEDGRLAGVLFAGSDTATIVNRAENVESDFGVRFGAEPLDPPADTEVPTAPTREWYTLEVTRRREGPVSIAYSFSVAGGGSVEVEGAGRSSTVVGERVNAYTVGWTNRYRVRGALADTSFPDNADVKIDGETVPHDEVLQRTRRLAGIDDDPGSDEP